MDVGMLWFDDGPAPLKEKVARAVTYYREKYGEKPTLCLVHPSTLNGSAGAVNGVEVRAAVTVLPHHFWIGVEEEARPAKRTTAPRKKAA